ncbi:MAG: haloalkane dehalogenase, partial [Pseudonocardiales bacterium]|nr:haloalkane dehalogenase [Pseudonocardiales bacterium]
MRTLRTSEDLFGSVPDFHYDPCYAELSDDDGSTLRIAYIEAGPKSGPVTLLMHGEPTWSFLYRMMIPVLADA